MVNYNCIFSLFLYFDVLFCQNKHFLQCGASDDTASVQTCLLVIITHIWSGPACSMLISAKQLHIPHKALQAEAWHLALSHGWGGGLIFSPVPHTYTTERKHASVHTCLRAHLVPSIKSSYLNNRAQERKRADCTAASNKDKRCMTFNSTIHCRTQPRTGCLLSVGSANKKANLRRCSPACENVPFLAY